MSAEQEEDLMQMVTTLDANLIWFTFSLLKYPKNDAFVRS